MITYDNEKLYSFDNLKDKYHWETKNRHVDAQIVWAERRGVKIEPVVKRGPTYFRIIDDSNYIPDEEWTPYPKDPRYEVTKNGLVRNAKTKGIIKCTSVKGYLRVTTPECGKLLGVHRMVLETYAPIQDCEFLYVDHINGIRHDNRLENLRWVTPSVNSLNKNKNWLPITENVQKLINFYGYEKTLEMIASLLPD